MADSLRGASYRHKFGFGNPMTNGYSRYFRQRYYNMMDNNHTKTFRRNATLKVLIIGCRTASSSGLSCPAGDETIIERLKNGEKTGKEKKLPLAEETKRPSSTLPS